jgi:cytochrome c oxidase accessory protein FixG
LKKAAVLRDQGQPAGDCIDCLQCVHVCPTGVDIRGGSNLGCIQCGLCIDACDAVMAKTGRPVRLIAYDTDVNIHRRQENKPAVYKLVRPRTAFYAAIIALVGGLMLYTLATRRSESVSVIHDRNPIFVRLADGAIRNAFTVRVLNKALETRVFELTVEGLPGLDVTLVGDTVASDNPLIVVGPDQTRELRALITTHTALHAESMSLTFTITDAKDGSKASALDHFRGPQ